MTYKEIKLIKNPVEYNQNLENLLQIANEIPTELIQEFYEAYINDNAASINWLKDKLIVMLKRVKKEESINIGGNLYNKNEYLEWIKENFSHLTKDIK